MSRKLRYLYRAYRYRYRVDRAELRFVCANLTAGQVAVDIGCHKGAYTYWMRRRVGPSGTVFAFEPQSRQVEYLRQAFSTMRYGNVTLVPMAVSDRVGQLPLHIPPDYTHAASLEKRSEERGAQSGANQPASPDSGSSHLEPHSSLVDVTTLDAFFSDKPCAPHLVKIDVEGHELAVLEGARQILRNYRPAILVECEARHRHDGDVRPVFEFLESLGYMGSFFQRGHRHPLREFDPAVHQCIDDPATIALPRGYVNNFAFERMN